MRLGAFDRGLRSAPLFGELRFTPGYNPVSAFGAVSFSTQE